MLVKRLDHINISVTNIESTLAWYKKIFGFELVEHGEQGAKKWAIMQSGEALLCFIEYPNRKALENIEAHRMNHFGLTITDEKKWETIINVEKIELLYGGTVHNYPHSKAWYIKDPNGYEIEVALWDNNSIKFNRI